MSARCETIGKFVLPVFRALVAKELVNVHGLTQVQAAQKLGTTQAAISQYVNSKRALKGAEQFGDVLVKLQVLAKQTAVQLVEEKLSYREVTVDFCKLCAGVCPSQSSRGSEDYAI
jgi:predicted transcriptional regulator